jgi:hypothetical protein
MKNSLRRGLSLSEDTIIALDPNIPPDQRDGGSPKFGLRLVEALP